MPRALHKSAIHSIFFLATVIDSGSSLCTPADRQKPCQRSVRGPLRCRPCCMRSPDSSIQGRVVSLRMILRFGLMQIRGMEGNGVVNQQINDGFLIQHSVCRKPGSFCGVRLLQGRNMELALPSVCDKIATAIFDWPPYELRWLKGLSPDMKVSIPLLPQLIPLTSSAYLG